jgi:hypothetical protein
MLVSSYCKIYMEAAVDVKLSGAEMLLWGRQPPGHEYCHDFLLELYC